MRMLTEICQYLKNWFNRRPDGSDYPKYFGEFEIADGELVTDQLAVGQYYRVMGSLFNDGVHRYGEGNLTDETFDGAIWSMGVPAEILKLADDVTAWQEEYGAVGSANMSPYASESFGGYSYTKASGRSGSSGASSASDSGTWQAAFYARLAPWRKI